MSYVAIYRKFRPQTFEQVKGQDSIVRTLRNQIRNERIGHAYLFTGTRGTGKTSVARIFAKAINCMNPKDGEPCNECENCKAISAGSFMDVVEIDAASNTGVDDIRRVIEEIQYTPVAGTYKVYIIDEAHMLSGAASNAFLKTLEEPPEYAVFILATTEPHKLPVTILSRCQRYDFKRITTDKIVENIEEYLSSEQIEAEEKAIRYIARAGDGSMRDSLSLLDKAIAFNLGKKLTYEDTLSALGTVDTEIFSKMFRYVTAADAKSAVAALDKEVRNGKDISRFVSDFVWYLRNLLLYKAGDGEEADMLGLSDENLQLLKEDARLAEMEVLMRYIRVLSELSNQLRFSNAKQVLADVAVIKLARPQMETDYESLLDRIRQLEGKLSGAVIAPPAAAARPVPAETAPAPVSAPMPERKAEPDFISFYENDAPEEVSNYNALFDAPPAPAPVQTAPPMQEVKTVPETPAFEKTAEPAPVASGTAQTVCANWDRVLAECTSPVLKVYLKGAKPKAADENTIELEVASDMALGRLESEKEGLKSLIKTLLGCEVALYIIKEGTARKAGTQQSTFAGQTVQRVETDAADAAKKEEEKIESLLEKNIKMTIETEDA